MGNGMAGLNGKTGEVVRWVLGGIAAALIAYYTAQGAITERLSAIEARQSAESSEMQRALARIETDIRELRQEVRELRPVKK